MQLTQIYPWMLDYSSFVCLFSFGRVGHNYPKVRHSCISMVEENDTDTPTMSIHEIHPKSQNIFNSQISKHSSTKICFKYVRLMPISLLSVKYGLWVKGDSQARSVRLWLDCLGMAGQHFGPPTKMADCGEFVPGFSSTGLPGLNPGRVWQDHEYSFCH